MIDPVGQLKAQVEALEARHAAELAALRARQARLERRSRALCSAALVVLVGGLGLLLGRPAESQVVPRPLRVRAPFTVLSPQGATLFQILPDGTLQLNDIVGLPVLAATPLLPNRGLSSFDRQGLRTAHLGQFPGSASANSRGLQAFDTNGRSRAEVGTNPGSGFIDLFNSAGGLSFRAP